MAPAARALFDELFREPLRDDASVAPVRSREGWSLPTEEHGLGAFSTRAGYWLSILLLVNLTVAFAEIRPNPRFGFTALICSLGLWCL